MFRWTVYLGLLLTAFSAGCKPPSQGEGPQGRRAPGQEERRFRDIKPSAPFLTPVLAQRVERGEISSTIATTCTVVPIRSRLLRTEEAGRLHFAKQWSEGDFVEKGTVIARVESESLNNEIKTSNADLELAHESLDISKKSMESAVREYETLQDLYIRGIAAQKDVDSANLSKERAINDYRQRQISLEKAKTNLQTLKDRLERLEVVAPYDGLLVARATIEGSTPFSTSFGTETLTDLDGRLIGSEQAVCGIIDMGKALLRCDVTSRDIDSVRLGQKSMATIYSSEDLEVEGKVLKISKAVSQSTRAFQVDVEVDNPDLLLRPGMFGRVDIVTDTIRDAVSIPKEVITRRNNRDVVFVAEKGVDVDYMVAREVPVETGLEGRDTIEVTWGLKEGDSIVIRGFEVLQDQTPVTVVYPDDPIVPGEEEADAAEEPANEQPEDSSSEGDKGR